MTLTASVTTLGPSTPTGSVTFEGGPTGAADTIDVSVPLDATGHATLTIPASQLGVGTFVFRAYYNGDANNVGSVGDAATLQVTAVPPPLMVTTVERFGYHEQPTTVDVTFSAPLDPTRAQEAIQYEIFRLGPKSRLGPPIALKHATYDAAASVVTLDPARRLNVHDRYELVVIGSGPSGLIGTSGQRLAGAGGVAGTDFTTVIDRATLAGPFTSKRRPSSHNLEPKRAAKVEAVSAKALDHLATSGHLHVDRRANRGRG